MSRKVLIEVSEIKPTSGLGCMGWFGLVVLILLILGAVFHTGPFAGKW